MARFAFVLSLVSVASCFSPPYLFYGMMCSILATLLAVAVIFIRMKYEVPTRWNHIAYITIAFASAPVIYVIILLFILKS